MREALAGVLNIAVLVFAVSSMLGVGFGHDWREILGPGDAGVLRRCGEAPAAAHGQALDARSRGPRRGDPACESARGLGHLSHAGHGLHGGRYVARGIRDPLSHRRPDAPASGRSNEHSQILMSLKPGEDIGGRRPHPPGPEGIRASLSPVACHDWSHLGSGSVFA